MGLRDLARGLAELLLPPCCAGCGRPTDDPGGGALCPACAARLPWLPPGPLPEPPPGLDACFAAVAFAGDAEAWVHRFKYPAPGLAGLDPGPAAVLRQLVRAAAGTARGGRGDAPGAVVPVPLHARRLRRRGFNPAALLAREVACASGARLDCRALERCRDTPSQTGLDRRGRRRNVAGAFRCAAVPARVWLVDDVTTTGSTLGEAARALHRAGARRVVGVCAARTP